MIRVKLDSSLKLVKALRMAENPMECHTTLEKSGTKGKRKCTKDSDFNPSVVSRDVLEDTAIGAGESATRSRSVGFKREYTENIPPQDPLQRDIRERSNSAEKTLRKGKPQPGPDWISR